MRDKTIVQFTFMLISQLVNYAGNIPNSPTSVGLRRPIHVATLQSDAYTMSVADHAEIRHRLLDRRIVGVEQAGFGKEGVLERVSRLAFYRLAKLVARPDHRVNVHAIHSQSQGRT